jgi:hypothetical protein
LLFELIRRESANYSTMTLTNNTIASVLFDFLRRNAPIYKILDNSAQVLIKQLAETDINLYIKSWFMREDNTSHFQEVMRRVKTDNFTNKKSIIREQTLFYYCEHLIKNDLRAEYYELLIFLWGHIGSYDTADARYDWFIKPALEDKRLNREELIQILEISNRNSQIYDRTRGG